MGKKENSIGYRAILCKYNEIGLKSSHYQKKLLSFLVNSIKKICLREELSLQSTLTLSGRLIFFFPSKEIPKAITVFRYIIGLQSISPAISVIRKYEKLRQTFISYALSLLRDGNTFTINFKTVVSYFKEGSEIKNDLNQEIIRLMSKLGQTVKVSHKNPDYSFNIEIREKGVYIYAFSIPTIYAGFPIETKNALLSLWDNGVFSLISAVLMVRRGAIVSPVLFTDQKLAKNYEIPPDSKKYLEILAKFYPDPLPVHIFSLLKLKNYLVKKLAHAPNSNINDIKNYVKFASLKILEILILQSREESSYTYNKRKLHYKGLISSNIQIGSEFFSIIENFNSLLLTPLTGLNEEFLQKIEQQLRAPSGIFDMKSLERGKFHNFSFNSEVLNSVKKFQSRSLIKITPNSKEESHDKINEINEINEINKVYKINYSKLRKFFEKPEIINFLHKIIRMHKVDYISGKILL
ncbi:MAG: THUMP domain-containing protein [Promethearchaeota archaeon]